MKQEYLDGTEIRPGYCRALRVDNTIFISGTGAVDKDWNIASPTVEGQARFIYKKIDACLKYFGGDISNLVRVHVFLTDGRYVEEYNKVHSEVFAHHRPTSNLLIVSGLPKEGLLVQVEGQAFI